MEEKERKPKENVNVEEKNEMLNVVKTSILSYDKNGRLVYAKVPDENGEVITHSIGYNTDGDVIYYQNSHGYSCTCEYTDKHVLKDFKDSNGYSHSREFDNNGKLISEIYRNEKSTFEYDEKSRCIKQKNPDGSIVSYTYDTMNRISTISSNGKETNILYTPTKELSEFSDGEVKPVEIHRHFDGINCIKEVINYDDKEIDTVFTYNNNNQETIVTSKNYFLHNLYDYEGNKIYQKIVSSDENVLELRYAIYDDHHNLLFSINNHGVISICKYDTDGNLIHYKDSEGFESWNSFEAGRNVIHRTIDNGIRKLIHYEYNEDGTLKKDIEIDNDNVVHETRYTYGENVSGVFYPDGDYEDREYNDQGAVIKIYSRDFDEYFQYKDGVIPTSHIIRDKDKIVYAESCVYNDNNELIVKFTTHHGRTVTELFDYDDAGNEIFYQRF